MFYRMKIILSKTVKGWFHFTLRHVNPCDPLIYLLLKTGTILLSSLWITSASHTQVKVVPGMRHAHKIRYIF